MGSFRSDTRDGMYRLLTQFQVSHPALIAHIYRRRPGSFPDERTGFVGGMPETIRHDSGTRQRTMAPTIVLVRKQSDPASETADEMDDLVDAFLDHCTARPHVISATTVTSPTGIEDVELEADGTFYPAVIISFGETIAQEGRSGYGVAAHLASSTATPEAIALALNAAGLLSIASPPAATGESIALALIAAGLFGTGAVDPLTVTAEALVIVLIAAGLMA